VERKVAAVVLVGTTRNAEDAELRTSNVVPGCVSDPPNSDALGSAAKDDAHVLPPSLDSSRVRMQVSGEPPQCATNRHTEVPDGTTSTTIPEGLASAHVDPELWVTYKPGP